MAVFGISIWYFAAAVLGLFGIGLIKQILDLRRVVPANEVHIIQSRKRTLSYGKDTGNGNTYYEWPSWLPFIGMVRTTLPTSNFTLSLEDYEAFDSGRLPFVIDVASFFRVKDPNTAAQRVASFQELREQLHSIVKGAARTVLAGTDIEGIMKGRSEFGDAFTKEVVGQLENWGVETVKNIELMDIRDAEGSHVIQNIMAKKQSHIEMESRLEVAKNQKEAQTAEIEAQREVDLRKQEAEKQVGVRTVETKREIALQSEKAAQVVKEQEKETRERIMAVTRVDTMRNAEIARDSALVKAEQDKQTQILRAEGQLEAKKREAQGIETEGRAKGEAEKAAQLAPVQAQIELAREIGKNESYQKYLVTIRQVEALQAVGMKQAEALQEAEIKIIANAGDAGSGLSKASDVFSARGGMQLAAMVEGFAQSEAGGAILNTLGVKTDDKPNGEFRRGH